MSLFDELGRRPHEKGIGSMLMTDPDLPRDQFGYPVQVLFWFTTGPEPHITRLVEDAEGQILGYQMTAEGKPAIDPSTFIAVPLSVAEAARRDFTDP